MTGTPRHTTRTRQGYTITNNQHKSLAHTNHTEGAPVLDNPTLGLVKREREREPLVGAPCLLREREPRVQAPCLSREREPRVGPLGLSREREREASVRAPRLSRERERESLGWELCVCRGREGEPWV